MREKSDKSKLKDILLIQHTWLVRLKILKVTENKESRG